MTKIEELKEKIKSLKMSHSVCEDDCWYSCPKSGECCNDAEDECSCGADLQNAMVDECIDMISLCMDDDSLDGK